MKRENVNYSVINGVATVSLNRPQVLNAVNWKLGKELLDVLIEAKSNPDVRALILTGEGKAFCVGQDLKDLESLDELKKVIPEIYNPVLKELYYFPKPTLAAVNGYAVGGGLGFALACDMRYASEKAVFSALFSRIGAVADSGVSYLLPRLIGLPRTFELLYTGRDVPAEEARILGMVNKIIPEDKLMSEAITFMKTLAGGPTKTLALDKELVYSSWHETLERQLEFEGVAQEAAIATQDFKEGVSAFLEKRKPTFIGK